jgi:hypothetical protein
VPTFILSIPCGGVYLTGYEVHKKWIGKNTSLNEDHWLNHSLSGAGAEAFTNFVGIPMEVIKNRMQTNPNNTSAVKLVKSIYAEEGLRGFFRGYWLGMIVYGPGTIVYWITYEKAKTLMANFNAKRNGGGTPDKSSLSSIQFGLSSIMGTSVASLFTNPLDVTRTRWQIATKATNLDKNVWELMKRMWRTEGKLVPFYRGSLTRIFCAIPSAAITMTVYEKLKILLKEEFNQSANNSLSIAPSSI